MLSRLTKTEFELFGFIRNRWYFKRFIEPGPKISMSKEVQKKEGRSKKKRDVHAERASQEPWGGWFYGDKDWE